MPTNHFGIEQSESAVLPVYSKIQLSAGIDIPREWYLVWFHAIFRPSLKAFSSLARDPRISMPTALAWLFIPTTLLWPVIVLVPQYLQFRDLGVATLHDPWLIAISGAPIAGLVVMAYTVGAVAAMHAVARALDGKGSYVQLFRVFAAFSAPLSILELFAHLSPFGSDFLVQLLECYWLALAVAATGAVHRFGWNKAATAAVLSGVSTLILLNTCVILLSAYR